MNKTKLITYLKNPNQLTSKGLDELEDIVNKYPYFLGARLLLAKASHEKKHPKAKKRIASASIYSTDRILLKKYLRGNLFFLEKSTAISVETTSNTTELSVNSAVPEAPSNQLDSLLEELQRDMKNLKNSRKKFGEIQDKIEEDNAIYAPLKKIDAKDNKSLDNVQNKENETNEKKKNKEKLKTLEITQAIIEKAKSEVQDEDKENEKKVKKDSEVIGNGNKEIDKSDYSKNLPSLTADSKLENKKEEPQCPLREQHDDQLLPKNRETNFFDNFAQEKESSSKDTKIDDPQKSDTHPSFDESIADNPPMLDQSIENTNNTEKTSQVNLINKFIKEPSQMKYQKKKESISDDLSKESSVWDSNIASEYLAEIYIAQGNKFRAIKIYEALILKYPEKKSYFADLILKIK